jgi:DNA polymerase-1
MKPLLLDGLRSCQACELCSPARINPVPGVALGEFDQVKYALIGEAPGRNENARRVPFVGLSGTELMRMLKLADIPTEQCYITNIAKGWPPANAQGKQKKPSPSQQRTCVELFLWKELEVVKPEVIITLGATALQWFVPGEKISDNHGQVFDWNGTPVFAVNHPAAALHNPRLMKTIEDDFKAFKSKLIQKADTAPPWEIIENPDDLKDFFQDELIAFDFETSDLRIHQATIVGMSVANSERAAYIPVQLYGNSRTFIKELAPLWDRHLVAHNAKFEAGIVRRFGGSPSRPIEDTMLLAALMGKPKGLKSLTLHEFGYKMTEIEELIGPNNKNQLSMEDISIEEAAPYACADAWFTRKLWNRLTDEIDPDLWQVYTDIERPLIVPVVKMESHGIRLDTKSAVAAQTSIMEMYEEERKALAKASGDPDFNPVSPKQSLELLQSFGSKVKSTNAKILHMEGASYPICFNIIQSRHLRKLAGTYGAAIENMGDRAYGSANPTGTETGRFSYSGWRIKGQQWGVNLQTIPRPKAWEEGASLESNMIRRCFIADPGCSLIDIDYSQIELRVMAHLSLDQNMTRIYQEGGDIHAEMQDIAQLDSILPNADSDALRRVAKILNFSITYNPDDHTASYVVQSTAAEAKVRLSYNQSKALVQAKRQATPGVSEFYKQIQFYIKDRGYVETEMGRRLYTSWIRGGNRSAIKANMDTLREAINMPVQGTSADILKLAIIKLHQTNPYPDRFLTKVVVHDDIVFQCPSGMEAELLAWAVPIMENVYTLRVPILVEAKVGPNWADMEKIA